MNQDAPTAQHMTSEDEIGRSLPDVSIYGDLAGSVTSIPICMLSLVVRVGMLEDRTKILVPMTELQLYIADADNNDGLNDEVVVATVIPLENAAFIIAEMSSDLEIVCDELAAFSSSSLKPEPGRLAQCIKYLHDAQGKISSCMEKLEALSDNING